MINEDYIKELLRTNSNGSLYHREGQELEFKEQFNFGGLADYLRDFSAFANNKGGYLIFGVTDSPRKLKGLTGSSLQQFEKIDPEKITGYILEIYSSQITWEQIIFENKGMSFGVFKIYQSSLKPVIAKKDEGKDQVIKNGDIYFRYGGRTQKIQYSELESIINHRIEHNNSQWLDLMSKIGRAGPTNAAILDTEKSIIEKEDTKILVMDEDLAKKLKFIKEGEFVEKRGASALKLIGDVVPIDRIEVVKKIKENLIREYPLTAVELIEEVKKRAPGCKQNDIYKAISENGIKEDPEYSVFNFRSKKHEDKYKATGRLPSGTPSIYKPKAVELVTKILLNEKK